MGKITSNVVHTAYLAVFSVEWLRLLYYSSSWIYRVTRLLLWELSRIQYTFQICLLSLLILCIQLWQFLIPAVIASAVVTSSRLCWKLHILKLLQSYLWHISPVGVLLPIASIVTSVALSYIPPSCILVLLSSDEWDRRGFTDGPFVGWCWKDRS